MRKLFVGSIVIALCALGWSISGLGETLPAPRGELRIVDTHTNNWASIVYHVFEHLIEHGKDGTLVPGLATSWRWLNDRTLELTLRQGVTFHNGEAFDAEIVQLNLQEQAQLRHTNYIGSFLSFKPGWRPEMIDRHTVRLILPEPDGAALARLSFLHLGNRQFYRELGWGEKHW